MTKKSIIRQISARIPKGKKVYLDGHYSDGERTFLWWYAYKDCGILWIDFESKDSSGRCEQHAEDFDTELLESVLRSMTNVS